MSETRNAGCGFWAILVLAVLAISGISYQQITAAVQAVLPLPVSESIAPQEENLPFTLQDSQIIYTYSSTLDWPCNYIIQGRILDLAGKPVTDILINLQVIEDEGITPTSPTHFYPGFFTDDHDPSFWALLMSSSTALYTIWLTDPSGKIVSPTIYILPQDCRHNVANLTFVQQQPIH